MTGTKITMTGADEAHYLHASRLTTRLLRFPDGMSRHFTLQNAHWRIVDQLVSVRGWEEDAFARIAFANARKYCRDPRDFEKELRDSVRIMISVAAPYAMNCAGRSNDNKSC